MLELEAVSCDQLTLLLVQLPYVYVLCKPRKWYGKPSTVESCAAGMARYGNPGTDSTRATGLRQPGTDVTMVLVLPYALALRILVLMWRIVLHRLLTTRSNLLVPPYACRLTHGSVLIRGYDATSWDSTSVSVYALHLVLAICLSCYAFAMRCLVLTGAMLLPDICIVHNKNSADIDEATACSQCRMCSTEIGYAATRLPLCADFISLHEAQIAQVSLLSATQLLRTKNEMLCEACVGCEQDA
eukprot:1000472-Rhodomonas_salina.2